jgi:cytochrome c oxidase cbb3-type subunit 3
MRVTSVLLLSAAVLTALASCKREERGFRVQPPAAQPATQSVTLSELHAGSSTKPSPITNDYEMNAFALSQGQQLYERMNCVGCHFHGGGGIGPPLMDDKWIYGSNPEQIYATIIEGRPNGMPSFRGRIVDYQVWQIAAYVRSLSGLANSQAAPGREEHMQTKPPENSMPTTMPVISIPPRP